MRTEKQININRRHFIGGAGAALSAAALAEVASVCESKAAEGWPPSSRGILGKKDLVLFQGDSITDAGRSRERSAEANDFSALGTGYAWLAAVELFVERPDDEYRIYNRGVSGNKVFQLADRWDADCLALNPDVLSILIGVNDFWHRLDGKYDGNLGVYERDFRALLARTKAALPKTKIVICEPFVLRCGVVNDKWFPEFDNYRAAAKRVAETFSVTFIPFQTMFDEAVKHAPPAHWATDGVHPTPAGASLMAYFWLRTVAGKR